MKLKSIKLTSVEIKDSLSIFTDTSKKYGQWEVEPEFGIYLNNEDTYSLEISVEVLRTLGMEHGKIVVLTSFELEVIDKDYLPKTDQDFVELASLQQIAIAHARAFFLVEANGTKFAGEFAPVDEAVK